GATAGRQQILERRQADLQQIYDEYLRQAAEANYRPSDDALAAWAYLFPTASAPQRSEFRPQPGSRLLADAEFQDVVRRGSREEIFHFVEARSKDIAASLASRLAVQLG